MKIYIAGKMSGIPQFNIPAFDMMAALLRKLGYEVVSPAELDGEEKRAVMLKSMTGSHADLPVGDTWGFYLGRDVQMLADDGIEAVVLLPGWANSPGALVETFVARRICGLPVYYLDGVTLRRAPDSGLAHAWSKMEPV